MIRGGRVASQGILERLFGIPDRFWITGPVDALTSKEPSFELAIGENGFAAAHRQEGLGALADLLAESCGAVVVSVYDNQHGAVTAATIDLYVGQAEVLAEHFVAGNGSAPVDKLGARDRYGTRKVSKRTQPSEQDWQRGHLAISLDDGGQRELAHGAASFWLVGLVVNGGACTSGSS